MSSVQQKGHVQRFIGLDGADRRLLMRATLWLAVARLMLALMSFRRLSARIAARPGPRATVPDPGLLQRIGDAVAVAARYVPWRSDCFPQTIAARMLLRRHGLASTIHLGVERVGEDELAGHAWLSCGETVVTGGSNLDRFTELHRFRA